MRRLPRLALAIPDTGPGRTVEPAVATLAMMAGLALRGRRVQHFRSRALPSGSEMVERATGFPGRHLDAWLMPPQACREVFVRGCRNCDLAVIEGPIGSLATNGSGCPVDDSGRLGPLAAALDAPVVAVIPCPDAASFHLPGDSSRADAFLLDQVKSRCDYDRVRRWLELAWRKPVIGAVEALPALRAILDDPIARESVPAEGLEQLGQSFLRFADFEAIRALSTSRELGADGVRTLGPGQRRFRVAFAMDEAFGVYFPDTFEVLEALGAELLEFSPLRDESLPDGLDLVMIGCGHPERHAGALAENFSLISALKHHVCRGLRLYAEGGGAAYLSRSMRIDGRAVPGAGILPVDAVLEPDAPPPHPICQVLNQDSWLGPSGTSIRGYRSHRWRFLPAADPMDCPGRSGVLTPHRDMFFRHHAIGSLVHLHPAALPDLIHAFAGPHRPSLGLPARRSVGSDLRVPPPRPG